MPRLMGECGSSLVEYALAVLLFFSLLFGICGFGHALYAYHFVSHAAKSAARWAAVNGGRCASDGSCTTASGQAAVQQDIANYVTGIVPPGIDPAPAKLVVTATWLPTTGTCSTASNAPGCTVEVHVSYRFAFIFPLISASQMTMSSASQMIVAH